jgi:hypothetical protein
MPLKWRSTLSVNQFVNFPKADNLIPIPADAYAGRIAREDKPGTLGRAGPLNMRPGVCLPNLSVKLI